MHENEESVKSNVWDARHGNSDINTNRIISYILYIPSIVLYIQFSTDQKDSTFDVYCFQSDCFFIKLITDVGVTPSAAAVENVRDAKRLNIACADDHNYLSYLPDVDPSLFIIINGFTEWYLVCLISVHEYYKYTQ